MRYLVFGAGAVGGALGGRLQQSGHDVVLIARGPHLDALRRRGLELRDPVRTAVLRVSAVGSPAEARPRRDDVVILAVKSQETEAALRALAAAAPPEVAVVCAQNGVENERTCLRHFERVYGMRVFVAATHLEPGVVEIGTAPVSGILDLGGYPAGRDEIVEEIVGDLQAAGFDAEGRADVMRYKYRKLLSNLWNAVEAAVGVRDDPVASALGEAARDEALACFAAAGIELGEDNGDAERQRLRGAVQPVAGEERAGGSSWQSLKRGTGNIEADYLNGEIVLLGRLYGVPTPVNARLQRVAGGMARSKAQPGSLAPADLL